MSIKSTIATISGKSPVDAIMSVFTNTIANLEKVAEAQKVVAIKNGIVAFDATKRAEKAYAERDRALTLASKLNKLIGE